MIRSVGSSPCGEDFLLLETFLEWRWLDLRSLQTERTDSGPKLDPSLGIVELLVQNR
jgi:hypothetical protein